MKSACFCYFVRHIRRISETVDGALGGATTLQSTLRRNLGWYHNTQQYQYHAANFNRALSISKEFNVMCTKTSCACPPEHRNKREHMTDGRRMSLKQRVRNFENVINSCNNLKPTLKVRARKMRHSSIIETTENVVIWSMVRKSSGTGRSMPSLSQTPRMRSSFSAL
jgi:hypothetical protein